MNEYSTLAKMRQYLGHDDSIGAASADAEPNAILLRLLYQASRAIDHYTRRHFYPKVETRFYDLKDARELRLEHDLLELQTLKTQNGACTVASGVLFLAAGRDWNQRPYDRIVFDRSSGSLLNFSGTPQRANEVTGVWGYHEAWDEAWVDTGTSLAVSYTASGGSIALAGAGSVGTGASDAQYFHPRLSPGDLIRIGDQYLHVRGGAASGNGTVLVQPFANGTTAASHAVGASIAKFAPEADIETATLRYTAWLYAQKDTPYQVRQANVTFGTIQLQDDIPLDVKDKINRFVKFGIESMPE